MTTVEKDHHNPSMFADFICGLKPLGEWIDAVSAEVRALWYRLTGPEPDAALFAQGRLDVAKMRVQSTNGSPVVEFEVRRADKPRVYRRTLDANSAEFGNGGSQWIPMSAAEIYYHKTVSSPIGEFLDDCGVGAPWADSRFLSADVEGDC